MNEKNPEQPEGKTAPENTTDMDRREFLATTAAVGGAMVLGFWLPPRAEASSVPVAAQPWYREAAGSGSHARVTIAPDGTGTHPRGQNRHRNRTADLKPQRGAARTPRYTEKVWGESG